MLPKTAAFTVPASLTGDVTVTYTVTDLAGNTTTKTDQLAGNVLVDTTAPSFTNVYVNQTIVSTASDKQVYLYFNLDENVNSNGVVTTHYTAPGGTEVELTSTSKSAAVALNDGTVNSKVWVQKPTSTTFQGSQYVRFNILQGNNDVHGQYRVNVTGQDPAGNEINLNIRANLLKFDAKSGTLTNQYIWGKSDEILLWDH